jgi:hypothetical protein
MSGLIDPKKAVADGMRVGLISVPGVGVTLASSPDYQLTEYDLPDVRLPQEAGIASIPPAPKVDGRTKAVRRRPLKPNHRPKYVITKSQLLAERPHLYL